MTIIESHLKLKRPSLTGNEIKLIACVSMLAAHLVQSGLWDSLCTSTVWPQIGFYLNCTIGRIAFPLFAFFIAEGATKTHNIREYIARMAIFALFSEIPFNLVFFGQSVCWDTQNVGLTFLFSLCFIYLIQLSEDSDLPRWGKDICACISCFFAIAGGYYCHCDYGAVGIACVLVFYICKSIPISLRTLCICIMLIVYYGASEFGALLSIPILLCYNGKKTKNTQECCSIPLLFYTFYPLHLTLLAIVKAFT